MAQTAGARLYGGIEAGGTKFVCAVGTDAGEIVDETRFPTTTPDETIGQAIEFFQQHQRQTPLAAIGIGAFGPVDLQPDSPTYGFITTTPKQNWPMTDLAGTVKRELNTPVGFDTDVNVAALGEYRWGAAQGLDTFIYLTIGTGFGGGGMAAGNLLHGLVHPEMGHIRITHDLAVDPFTGNCPFHGDCLEGLASGPAVEKRWGTRAEFLGVDHPAWALEAHYLALALNNFICTLSPQRIIMGGGIMQQEHIFPLVRRETQQLLNNYVQSPAILNDIDNYIVPPKLGAQAGVLGAIALAQHAATQAE